MQFHESKLQSECVKWFRLQYPNHVLFSIPNGSKKSIIQAVNMKREGMLKGIPDLFLAHKTRIFGGLFIEMKYGKGQTSIEQKEVIDNLLKKGYQVYTCNSFDLFKEIIESYLKD